ncbi:MAG: hypothetical protein QM728_09250 [Gordonia sp. (in: high G+C Gram-positive bacteria)]|uniref:hypothetical protein n=1 Tax=Gordonia sp. (in: high G+C Gram-positive bacteria) TaxID=84139 RepID=UPI0039E574AC
MTAPLPQDPGSLPPGGYPPPAAQPQHPGYPQQPGHPAPAGYPQQPQGYAQPGQPYPPQPPGEQHPYAQGPGVYTAVFKSHTGLLIMALTTPNQVTGSLADVRRAFWRAQLHCLFLGWFGILSMLAYNWIAIFGNIGEWNRVKTLAKQYGES